MRGRHGVQAVCARKSAMPASMARANKVTSIGARARAATAGPGQSPTRPQPTPKMAAPITRRRSMSRAVGSWNAPANSGAARRRTSREAERRRAGCAGEHEGEAGIPCAGEVEEVQHLRWVHHLRDGETDPEKEAGGERGDDLGHVSLRSGDG